MNTNVPAIDKVFVLMLENRSFDHMLGFSAIRGTDAITGKSRSVNGLEPDKYFNLDSRGRPIYATTGATATLTKDAGHEFEDVVEQLCGSAMSVDPVTGAYPKVTNSGFVTNYLHDSQGSAPVMQCFGQGQLPVLQTLATEFAVCDAWYCSLPGPTWPNRFFFHAASSGGMVESPSSWAVANSTFFQGYSFQQGTIFDLLDTSKIEWVIYEGDAFPQSFAIKGMTAQWIKNKRFRDFSHFTKDVSQGDFKPQYVFIEPNYGRDILPPEDFRGGNSQHPLDDVFMGEQLIKTVYEAVRNSPHWSRSLLLITYDEHGGFYDHVPPPGIAVAPGDATTVLHQPKFDFKQYGVRVPTVIISPYTARNLIDSTVYDHTSFLRTIELLFDLPTLTNRDANAADFVHLLRSVQQPRVTSISPTSPGPEEAQMAAGGPQDHQAPEFVAPAQVKASDIKSIEPSAGGNEADNVLLESQHYAWLHVAFLRDLAIQQHDKRGPLALNQLRQDVFHFRTVGQARDYLKDVRKRVRQFKERQGL